MVKVSSTSTSPPIYHSNFFLEPKQLIGANPEEEAQGEEAVDDNFFENMKQTSTFDEEAHELDASIASLIHRAVVAETETATRGTSTSDNFQQAPQKHSSQIPQASSTISNSGSSGGSLISWERVMSLYITAALIFMCVAVAYYGARISQNMSSISQKLEETNLLSIKANKTKGIAFKPSSSSSTRLTKVPLVLPSTVNTSMNWVSFHRERLTLGLSSKVLITGTFTYEAADGIYLLLRAKIGSHYSPMTAIYQPPGTKKVSVPVSFMVHETLEAGRHPVIFEAKASCLRYGRSCNTDNEVLVEDMKQLQVYLLE